MGDNCTLSHLNCNTCYQPVSVVGKLIAFFCGSLKLSYTDLSQNLDESVKEFLERKGYKQHVLLDGENNIVEDGEQIRTLLPVDNYSLAKRIIY